MSPGGIFIQGIISVFFGMTLLYLSIKVTTFFVERISKKTQEGAQDDK